MGDIDVLIEKDNVELVKSIFLEMNYKMTDVRLLHYTFETPNNLIIELHPTIVSEVDFEYEEFLNGVWNEAYLKSKYLYELNNEFLYVYLLIHVVKHLRTSGVGIRSILDLKLFKDYYIESIDFIKLSNNLHKLDLIKADEKMERLSCIFINQMLPSDKDLKIIEYILKSGIHGKGSEHDRFTGRRVFETEHKKQSKTQYFLLQIFPKKRYLENQYPYLRTHPWLLPWAWLVRIIKQLFKPKNTKQRIKAITNDDNVLLTKEVYDYFGI